MVVVGGVVAQAGQLIAERYRLEDRVGSGAMGVVWRAQDELLRRTVAVKQLLVQSGVDGAEANARAMREGRIAARLQQPNAVTVYDAADVDGSPWLVMEFVPAPSLAAVLAQRGKLPAGEVIRLGAQIASALAAAHANGIVHRDVKPGNVLLAEDGTAKITDFGISRANDEAVLTATGLVCGTPAYLAPEVAQGEAPDAASDVFALGATLYTAAEGQPPFGFGDNTLALLHVVAAGQIRPPTVTGPLAPVLTSMLAADPRARPTMTQARSALLKAATDLTTVRAADQLPPANADHVSTARVGSPPPAFPPPAFPLSASRPPASGPPASRPPVARPQAGQPFAGQPMAPPLMPAPRTRVVAAGKPKRGNAGLIATICVVVLLVVVTGILATKALNKPHTDNAATTPKLTYLNMRQQLIAYYALLPADTDDAFADLSPAYQDKTGAASFRAFYAGISQVSVKDILPEGPGNVEATMTFVKANGATSHELYHFSFTAGHGKLLISDAGVIRVIGK
jgi:serine/threonine protein kinase